jgi:hypothetical protein
MIRPLEPKDYPELERMIKESTHMYPLDFAKKEQTFVLDDEPKGFFTYMFLKGTPVLQLFYVDPKYRSLSNARRLIRGFMEKMKEYKRFIISAEQEPRLVEYFFKKKPAMTLDAKKFYVIEV